MHCHSVNNIIKIVNCVNDFITIAALFKGFCFQQKSGSLNALNSWLM